MGTVRYAPRESRVSPLQSQPWSGVIAGRREHPELHPDLHVGPAETHAAPNPGTSRLYHSPATARS